VLTDDGGVATRRRTGGNERRQLELLARAEDGVRKLGREGMRCGEGLGGGGLIALLRGPEAPERGGRRGE
jgi:hypothetical protein